MGNVDQGQHPELAVINDFLAKRGLTSTGPVVKEERIEKDPDGFQFLVRPTVFFLDHFLTVLREAKTED